MCFRSAVLFLLALLSSCDAQDPLHLSARPWRKYPTSPDRSHFSRSRPIPHAYGDLSAHFLDNEEIKTDRRARRWQVNLKTRNIGRLSWSSRIIWTNIATFAAQAWKPSFTQWGIKVSEKILRGEELYRLITPVFLHGGFGHIFTNMISLSRVGPDVERLFGSGRFLTTYMVSGMTGNLLSAYMSPNPGLGASGAVFGVVGAYYVFLTRNEWLLGPAGQSVTSSITQTMLFNIFLGALNPVIDNWAHLGGALGGAAMGYYFGPRLYLVELPEGGRIVMDRPIARLPRNIESIPGNLAGQIKRITRRMQVERYKTEMPTRPWQQRQQHMRQTAPNRSIKPGPVD
ncbi:predicted protein [Phaeodactylum tricornutum CCAP 1055/1]|jgi:membrane associated rhomboid family serine protease|uniref:Peptidase S54 rhomboid domain-containing protein n=2 Tax=Phaeodactylum tricornutum TaxID=2850 RepID=B7G2H6_PHATC|nr:predicted protein [Phaeodactylum tricornutum CCAP 1055/1]EEC47133.1 predicted protein [Phaeodactylum tricornutum CCAP 1055/1]|eukprot:XP_002181210.1 predicted protein [Phaeodactylum tricornutum CCAP 1055/1]